jgi:hypothetical protein
MKVLDGHYKRGPIPERRINAGSSVRFRI